jgi:hypothetical protein
VTLIPNLADRYGLRDPRAFDFPVVDRYERLFTNLGGGGPNFPVVPVNDPRVAHLADLFAARYIITPVVGPLPSHGFSRPVDVNPGALPRSWVAYSWRPAKGENAALFQIAASTSAQARDAPVVEGSGPAPARAGAAATPARITLDQAEHVRVQVTAQRAGYLILDDTYYPGWHATVDGRPAPILPANVNFRAVPIPPGPHVVSFRYDPASVTVGGAVSAASALVMVLAGGLFWLRGRRRRTGSADRA